MGFLYSGDAVIAQEQCEEPLREGELVAKEEILLAGDRLVVVIVRPPGNCLMKIMTKNDGNLSKPHDLQEEGNEKGNEKGNNEKREKRKETNVVGSPEVVPRQ